MSILFELERLERLRNDIKDFCIKQLFPITIYKMEEGSRKDGAICDTADWKDYTIDTPWRDQDDHRWFRTKFKIPDAMDGGYVEFCITTGREGEWDATNPQMLLYLNGEIQQGIDVNHRRITISNRAKAGDMYEVAMYAYSGSVKGDLILHTELILVEEEVEQFYYDFSIPVDTARLLCKSDEENCRRILQKLQGAADTLDLRKPYSKEFSSSIKKAKEKLKKEFYTERNDTAPVVSAIGHTHIDIAWLWTVEQTRGKVLRSFSTVLKLMEQYPEYIFMSSQPILYQFVKEGDPELYEKIKERIREGRWEVDGAMWLEADCNLPSGESLVRQIIKGHQFFKEEFGKVSKSLWLPDVFGYSAALPQILKKTGISYFVTTKIAWNQYNQLPNDTFIWKGMDGSEIFVYMPTACDFDKNLGLNVSFTDTRNTTTYTGIINPNMTLGTFKRFQNKDLTEDTLMLYGFGDGGGGPTKEMLENGRRLSYGMPGIPRIKQEREQDFLDRTYEKIAHSKEMPTWNGELYFEYHRGTYTSMAKNKRYNRKCEILYGQLEILSSMGNIVKVKNPSEVLKKGWDTILLNQFHDIIPGTAIKEVYEQTDKEYEEILEQGSAQLMDLARQIARKTTSSENAIVVFNTLGYDRDDLVTVCGLQGISVSHVEDTSGHFYEIQYVGDDSLIFYAKGIPSVGYKVFHLILGDRPKAAETDIKDSYENAYYRVVFNEKMEFLSLYEKESRKELLKQGRVGNELCAYEDRPMNWDNWDIDIFYQKKKYQSDWVSKTEIKEAGPLRTTFQTSYGFADSVINQKIYLYRDLPRIDFETQVEWREHHTLLKVNFPAEINATRATFEIQFGNTERETTNNHSWETAKFETCGHKWADLSESSAGISILNDCKYGHSIKEGEISLTLIKSGTYPHAEADIGRHEFTYSLYPHPRRWQEAKTIEMAYDLNVPLLVIKQWENLPKKKALLQETWSMLSCDKRNCFLETVKKAEDGNGFILRMYENKNAMTDAVLYSGQRIEKVYECDLLEQNLRELEHTEHQFEDRFLPYEIKTFRIMYQ